jgi:para-aminobenzoate synthetase component 1
MTTQEVDLALSPVDAVERLGGLPGVFAFDGGGPASWGCGHAIVGVRPTTTLQVLDDGSAVLRRAGASATWNGNPFDLLARFCGETRRPRVAAPFTGGVLVALSYDLRDWVEARARRRPPRRTTVLYAARYDSLLSYDYRTRTWRAAAADDAVAYAPLAARFAEVRPSPDLASAARIRAASTKIEYVAGVRDALGYIGAGDIYQVNLSQRFIADGHVSALTLYAAMQRRHPMPFSAYVDCGELALVSNSPECFLLRDQGILSTYPIKGTRARSADAATDRRLAGELRCDPKELAEHVMIVDLERNDLGRVCKTGSIHVDAFAHVESFPTLHHLVSRVSGEIADDVSLAEILRATFPGGSITGAPKIRAMEIIDEIEPIERGFYTGSIGFVDDCGRAIFNIAIRTAVVAPHQAAYHAGGGIVADSNPEREYEETILKAQPFFAALRAKAA